MSAVEKNPYSSSIESESNGEAFGEGNKAPITSGEHPHMGNLNRVRDILFGAEMREYEKKFSRLEERLLKVSSELKDEVRRSLDSLEGYVKQEVESILEQIKTERNERVDATDNLTRELREAEKSLERKVSQVDDQSAKNYRDLRQQLLDQSKSLTDEIRQKSTELTEKMSQFVQDLRTTKTDRYALASLFTEVALQLSHDAKISSEG